MKLNRKKGRGLRVVRIDGNRRHKLSQALNRFSDKKRRKELANDGNSPSDTPSKPKTKLTIRAKGANAMGNLRGTNPNSHVDSERARKIRAMRQIYNKAMPTPQCNGCAFSNNCPKFRAGYECAFLPFLNAHKVETIEDLRDYMKELLGANMRRVHLASIMETLSGGKPDIELSEQYALMFSQLKDLFAIETEANETDVTIETDDDTIIGKLFGNVGNLIDETGEALNRPVDVPALSDRHSETDEALGGNAGVNSEVLNYYTRFNAEEDRKKASKKGVTRKIVSAKLVA